MSTPATRAVPAQGARIDLHTHTTASDGTDTPAELIAAAKDAELSVIALTDHDTTAGWAPAIAALPAGLTLVPGAELSTEWRVPGQRRISVHLLAYLFDPGNIELSEELARVRDSRVRRGERIVERLVAAGVPIRWERVRELAAGGTVGRPHVGRALVEAGVVGSVDEAFRDYLYEGSPYYASKQDIELRHAVTLVRRAGGVPVLAHAFARSRGRVIDAAAIRELARVGLAGLEAEHIDHATADVAQLRELADELGLLVTGSSDYHGQNKQVPLGLRLTTPEAYAEIVAQATGTAPVVR